MFVSHETPFVSVASVVERSSAGVQKPCRQATTASGLRRSLAVLPVASWLGFGILLQAQNVPTPAERVTTVGTEVSSEYSWERRTGVSLDAHTAVFGKEPFHITFSISYEGLKQGRIPDSVEVVLVRELPSPGDVGGPEVPPALVVIDGLPVPLTRQTGDGPDRINAIVPFEIFQWMVGGKALEFEAFGRRFVLAAGQITFLKQTALEWGHPIR